MSPRVLIAFATREGQTEKVANRLSEHFGRAGADVKLINAATDIETLAGNLSAFDLLVFGASMHAGGLEKEIVRFINRHADEIAERPRSFFLVLLSAAATDPQQKAEWLGDAQSKIDAALKVPFDDCEMIAGALTYSRYSRPIRWLMQRISKQAGTETDPSRDYEYTDWEQVEAYAGRLLDETNRQLTGH